MKEFSNVHLSDHWNFLYFLQFPILSGFNQYATCKESCVAT